MVTTGFVKIGTCSWKYDSWWGLVYSKEKTSNHLEEYSRQFSTVEVDQWFWSLFNDDKPVLPKTDVVKEYAKSVPEGFKFTIKIPNSITLTHHYPNTKDAALVPNPFFLSQDLMERFLKTLEPLGDHIGPLMFQFEYLNKMKMAGVSQFLALFDKFHQTLPSRFQYCIEIRNPNYLKKNYYNYLQKRKIGHVFLQGYYMPSIFQIYDTFKDRLEDPVVIRLHGGDRGAIEKRTQGSWNEIVESRDPELVLLKAMVEDLKIRNRQVFINVNNHFEGSAPKTIEKIKTLLEDR